MYYLGVDCGNSGAFALVGNSGVLLVKKIPVIKSKTNGKYKITYDIPHIIEFITKLKREFGDFYVYIEQVGAAPEQGLVSTCSLCRGFGLLIGIISALGHSVVTVRPNIWKKDLLAGLPADKFASCVVVGRLFPKALPLLKTSQGKPDHNIADAILIAEWGRRNNQYD